MKMAVLIGGGFQSAGGEVDLAPMVVCSGRFVCRSSVGSHSEFSSGRGAGVSSFRFVVAIWFRQRPVSAASLYIWEGPTQLNGGGGLYTVLGFRPPVGLQCLVESVGLNNEGGSVAKGGADRWSLTVHFPWDFEVNDPTEGVVGFSPDSSDK
ncbi:hypothetical protein RHMOL_Rhmol12G0140400 [Rhododendron molle]|uniref:Uncharacterized protein n=1 Tax=Rhododendron molle TaxID=49168 RepID=A0ACC0LJ36_RHOML|nr:hypothetical protein RHMOL_Rhmol12G0140400 [Rhododendron molle]